MGLRFGGPVGKVVAFAGYAGVLVLLAARFGFAFYRGFAPHIVQRAEQLVHVPDLVGLGVVAPGAAQYDELHLIGDVPHLMQRAQTGGDLQIRVEPVTLGALAGRLVVQVAFRHAHVVGAVQACARARPGLREHGDGGHAGCGAAGFDLQRSHQQGLFGGRNAPGAPLLRAVFLRLLIKRQQLFLRHIADGAGYLAVSSADDAVERVGGKRGVGAADLAEDVLQCLFHSRYCTASRKVAKGWRACVKKSRATVRGSADAQTAPALSRCASACTKLGTRNAKAMVREQGRAGPDCVLDVEAAGGASGFGERSTSSLAPKCPYVREGFAERTRRFHANARRVGA